MNNTTIRFYAITLTLSITSFISGFALGYHHLQQQSDHKLMISLISKNNAISNLADIQIEKNITDYSKNLTKIK